MLLLALPACSEFRLDPVETDDGVVRTVVTEEFVQEPLPGVDLLFVIDDTASMAQEQDALGDGFSGLVGGLDEAGIGWQIGVVTTDMSVENAGWLRGDPFVLTASVPAAASRFAETVRVGTTGSSPEAGLAAALLALDLAVAGQPNAGFRRANVPLHVVFVSDADDQSDGWLGADPGLAFSEALAAHDVVDAPARVSAVVGDVPSGCTAASGSAVPGARYASAAEATGGVVASICAIDFEPLLESIAAVSVALPSTFALQAEPVVDTVSVEIDGVRTLQGWTVEAGDVSALRFEAPPPASSTIGVSYVVEVP